MELFPKLMFVALCLSLTGIGRALLGAEGVFGHGSKLDAFMYRVNKALFAGVWVLIGAAALIACHDIAFKR